MLKKTSCLLLALLMILSIVACSSESATSPSTDPPADSTTTTPVDTAETPTDSPEEPADTAVASNPYTLPFAETVAFDYWLTNYNAWDIYSSLTEHPAIAELSARTNVYPNYTVASTQAASEQYSLIVVSGDLYHVMQQANTNMSLTELRENDIAYDLTGSIAVYMPNYCDLVRSDRNLTLDVTENDGSYLGLYAIYDTLPLNWRGLVIRKDLLDAAGVDLPVTYDDWDVALEAMSSCGLEYNLFLPKLGNSSDNVSALESGFGVGSRFYQEDGQIKYGPMEDGFLDYLTKLNEWYNKGYIHQDFAGAEESQPNMPGIDYWDKFGASILFSAGLANKLYTDGRTDNEDFYLQAVANPVKSDGSSRVWSTSGGSGRATFCTFLTTACDDDLASQIMTYFDYLFSEEGSLVAAWGIQGDTFELDDNGNPYYLPRVTDSNSEDAIGVYAISLINYPHLYNDKEVALGVKRDPAIPEMQTAWGHAGTGFGTLPNLPYTPEESEQFGGAANDCNTYTEENVVKFIMGIRPLSEFNDFRDELRNLKIEDALEASQVAFDRYNDR